MPIRARSRSQETRAAALEAAREILVESGPQGLTLKAVADRVGCTHANLLHHFGSISSLHLEVGNYITKIYREKLYGAVEAMAHGRADSRYLVDIIFDIFGGQAALEFFGSYFLTQKSDIASPTLALVKQLVDGMNTKEKSAREMLDLAILTHTAAVGDALLGESLESALGLKRDRTRVIIAKVFDQWIERSGWPNDPQFILPEIDGN